MTSMARMEIPSQIQDTTHRLALSAKSHLAHLQDEIVTAKRIVTIWQQLDDYVSKTWMIHISNLIRTEHAFIKSHSELSDADRESLNDLTRRAASEAEQVMRRYPLLIEQTCRERDVMLDQDSRHPRYSFRNKTLLVDIDEKKRLAKLSTNESTLNRFPADVDAVVTAVERELKRLFDRPFNAMKFTKLLRRHYVAVCKVQKMLDGDAVPIRAITRRMTKNQKHFRLDEFVADLSRLLDMEVPVVNERRLDLQQTKDTKQGILLQGKAARGYIGFVLFRKAVSP